MKSYDFMELSNYFTFIIYISTEFFVLTICVHTQLLGCACKVAGPSDAQKNQNNGQKHEAFFWKGTEFFHSEGGPKDPSGGSLVRGHRPATHAAGDDADAEDATPLARGEGLWVPHHCVPTGKNITFHFLWTCHFWKPNGNHPRYPVGAGFLGQNPVSHSEKNPVTHQPPGWSPLSNCLVGADGCSPGWRPGGGVARRGLMVGSFEIVDDESGTGSLLLCCNDLVVGVGGGDDW